MKNGDFNVGDLIKFLDSVNHRNVVFLVEKEGIKVFQGDNDTLFKTGQYFHFYVPTLTSFKFVGPYTKPVKGFAKFAKENL